MIPSVCGSLTFRISGKKSSAALASRETLEIAFAEPHAGEGSGIQCIPVLSRDAQGKGARPYARPSMESGTVCLSVLSRETQQGGGCDLVFSGADSREASLPEQILHLVYLPTHHQPFSLGDSDLHFVGP